LEEILLKNVLILGSFTKRKISQGNSIFGETVRPEEIILRNKGKLTLKYLYKGGDMKNDPREIKAKFESHCSETGKVIKKGEPCIYYPLTKKVFCVDSKTAQDYRECKADWNNGYNY
jgi:hypothetical protein